MSLIIHSAYSSFNELVKSYANRVTTSADTGTEDRKLKIGLVNLMPEKSNTEWQWFKVMAQSSFWIEPQLVHMGTYQSTVEPEAISQDIYLDSKSLVVDQLDAIIITGAPVEHLDFESVAYWQELLNLFDRCLENKVPILSICWGAQALLYKRYGIEKIALGAKCFGLFNHEVIQSALGLKKGQTLILPHSRHTGWQKSDLSQCRALNIVLESEQAGPFLLIDEDQNYYFAGHGEYEESTLIREYERDINRGISLAIPEGYALTENGNLQCEVHWEQSFIKLIDEWLKVVSGIENGVEGRCQL